MQILQIQSGFKVFKMQKHIYVNMWHCTSLMIPLYKLQFVTQNQSEIHFQTKKWKQQNIKGKVLVLMAITIGESPAKLNSKKTSGVGHFVKLWKGS